MESRVACCTCSAESSTPVACALALILSPTAFSTSAQSPVSAATSSFCGRCGQFGRRQDGPDAAFDTSAGPSLRLWKNACHSASTAVGFVR